MNKFTLLTLVFIAWMASLSAQNRFVTRGAESGELYVTGIWYGVYGSLGPPFYDTVRNAIFRLTENGKTLSIQYDVDYFADDFNEPSTVMQPDYIFADATSGVVYNKSIFYKDSYQYSSLWVSFDYGMNWILREEGIGTRNYYSGIFTANNQSILYKGSGGMNYSLDYGETWTKIENTGHTEDGDIGFHECEFYGLSLNSLYYTESCFNEYITVEVDTEYISGTIGLGYPDAYRGGLPGEVYVSSWFPDWTYKVSFSADTGSTFRHVYISEAYDPESNEYPPTFMSDREPGVFYIIRRYEIENSDHGGYHLELCIEYYKNYGETLETVYCHDIERDYTNRCKETQTLTAQVEGFYDVRLEWLPPETDDKIAGYHVYRDNQLITTELAEDTFFCDIMAPEGSHSYCVVTAYASGCESSCSNRVFVNLICDPPEETVSEKIDHRAVALSWKNPSNNSGIEETRICRDEELIHNFLGADTGYIDYEAPDGNHQYAVGLQYVADCESELTWSGMETICATSAKNLTAEVLNGGYVFLTWEIPAETAFEIAGFQIFRNQENISGNLILENSFVDQVSVIGEYKYWVTILYDNDCQSEPSNIVEASLAIEDNDVSVIALYPNPTGNQLRIKSEELRIENVKLFDIFGRRVFETNETTFHINHLPEGVYIVKIHLENGEVVTRKMVKQ